MNWKHRVEFGDWHDKPAPLHAYYIYQALLRDRPMVDYVLESDEEAMDKYTGIMEDFDTLPPRTPESQDIETVTLRPLDDQEFDDLLDALYDWGDQHGICIG